MSDILGYMLIAGMFFGGCFLCYLPVFFLLRKVCKRQIPMIRQMVWLAFAAITFVILEATVLIGLNFHPGYHTLNLKPFQCFLPETKMEPGKMAIQNLANILMFVPVGVLFPVICSRKHSFPKTLLYAFAFSFGIEFVQYFTGRVADVDDLMLNTAGGAAGYLIFLAFNKVFGKWNWWRKANGSRTSMPHTFAH